MGSSRFMRTLKRDPKKRARRVQERVITLYGMLKSGVGRAMRSGSV